MHLHYSTSADGIDWERLAQLFAQTGLGDRGADRLEATFRGSQVVVFAHDGDDLVGAAWALSDHVQWSAIFDVAVDPAYQGQRIGAALVERVIAAAGTPNVMLQSMAGKEAFYERLGFKPMPAGMERRGIGG